METMFVRGAVSVTISGQGETEVMLWGGDAQRVKFPATFSSMDHGETARVDNPAELAELLSYWQYDKFTL